VQFLSINSLAEMFLVRYNRRYSSYYPLFVLNWAKYRTQYLKMGRTDAVESLCEGSRLQLQLINQVSEKMETF